jgi:hypothetical protein
VNGLEIGLGVLFLASAAVAAWVLVRARHAPPGGRHLPAGLAPSARLRRAKVLLTVGSAVMLANGVLWLLRGFGRVR